jgi:hypothetical protein
MPKDNCQFHLDISEFKGEAKSDIKNLRGDVDVLFDKDRAREDEIKAIHKLISSKTLRISNGKINWRGIAIVIAATGVAISGIVAAAMKFIK